MINRTFQSLGTDSTACFLPKERWPDFHSFFVKLIQILQVDLNTPTKQDF